MEQPALLDDAAFPGLLALFYERVRQDEALGRVFDAAVDDWSDHLKRLADFWSSVMLTTGRYKGNPVAKHLLHAHEITPAMFARWLAIWAETTNEIMPGPAADALQSKAVRIAERLQLAIHTPSPTQRAAIPSTGISASGHPPYRSTPMFDADTLPQALRNEHRTKPGAWAVIRVLEGCLRYVVDDGSVEPQLLTPSRPGLIEPEQPHHVEPIGPMKMRIDFYDQRPTVAA